MSRKIKGNGKHLTFSDRVYIEQELMQGSSFRDIAAGLGKDPSTISKEIRLHCSVAPNGTYRFPKCSYKGNYRYQHKMVLRKCMGPKGNRWWQA